MIRICYLAVTLLTVPVFAEEIPYEHFGRLPMVEMPTVSPDGRYVAVIVNSESGPTINVASFGSRELTPIIQLKYGSDRIDWISWANDDRLLISASGSELWMGDRIRVPRLFSIGRDGQDLQEIRRKTVREPAWWVKYIDTTRILSLLPEEPEYILMELYDELDEASAVFRVNIYENRFDKLFINDYGVNSWYADSEGEVVLGLARDDDTITLWYREGRQGEWEKLHTRTLFESETFAPFLIKKDKVLVVSDYKLGREAIWEFDIGSGVFERLIYAADDYDIDEPILAPDEDRLIGVSYYDHYRVERYFDPAHEVQAAMVKQSFPQHKTAIVSADDRNNRLIVSTLKDNSPPKFFWLDLEKKSGGLWYAQYPNLENKPLAPVLPFEFTASDGMKLNGYLTLPVANGKPPYPLVVFPHGGPQARDYQYFDPFLQFFANRGYAVIQVNFRGSTGFSNAYERAGYREWGQRMQEDVYDAIDWLAETNEEVDTGKACVVGGSYGGYVALVAAYQRPDDFKCFASMAGVTDLVDHANTVKRNDWFEAFVTRTIGNPSDGDDREALSEASPLDNLSRIKRPLLLIHGTYDTQVRVTQGREFFKNARRAKLDVEYIELDYGTHYFDEYQNRLAVFEALDSFLDKHL